MRINLILSMIIIPVLLSAQDITPDNPFHDNSSARWYSGEYGGYGVTCGTYNGVIYVFNYEDITLYSFPMVYTFRQNHTNGNLTPFYMGPDKSNQLEFGYGGETYPYDDGINLWRVFTFTYGGRLWYYQQIQNNVDAGIGSDDHHYTDCFAQIPESSDLDPYTYCVESSSNPQKMRMGAFELNEMLYFLTFDDTTSSSHYGSWIIEQFAWDETKNQFVYQSGCDQMTTLHGLMTPGIVKRLDVLGNEYVVVSTSGADSYVYKFVPAVSGGKTTFTVSSCVDANFSQTDVQGFALLEGSIRGKKTSESNEQYPDRITHFGIDTYTSSNGTYAVRYMEYRDDNGYYVKVHEGIITLPSSISPPGTISGGLQMCGTFELIPTHWSDAIDGPNGLRQYNWIFFPDGNKHFNAAGFQSDNWLFDDDDIVTSPNLNDTIQWGGSVRDLWTLVGIIDGAPPVCMDWYAWDSTHYNNTTEASSLEFSIENSESVDVSNTTEDQWSIGESIDVKSDLKKINGSLSEEYKYCNLFKKTVAHETEITVTYDLAFKLRPDNQDKGFFLWKVPEIWRFEYSLYPWWDTTELVYPIPNSLQYLFRVENYSVVPEPRPIEGFPFYVNEPNGEMLSDWKADARYDLNEAVDQNGVDPIISLSWVTHTGGVSGTMSVSAGSSSTYEATNTYEVKCEMGQTAKIPHVFRIHAGETTSWEGTYSSETTVTTDFKHSVQASLENLENSEDGINLSLLTMDVFMLTPEITTDLWYFDGLDSIMPWYVAYIVNSTLDEIELLTPGDGEEINPPEMIFTWEAENGPLGQYTLFISTQPNLVAGNVIYSDSIGDRSYATIPALRAEPGTTLYWTVRGYNVAGERVRSLWRPFRIKATDKLQQPSDLKALIFPNPSNSHDVRITIDQAATDTYDLRLLNIAGITLAHNESVSPGTRSLTELFHGLSLSPGIYLLVIRSGNEQVVKKMIIHTE